MSDAVYVRLAEALDRLPNRFPRTASGVEVRILERIYDPIDADIGAQMDTTYESADTIAAKTGHALAEVREPLQRMTMRDQVLTRTGPDGAVGYRLAPFIVGAYEGSLDRIDHQLAHLIEEYAESGGMIGIMVPGPAIHRVVPANGSIKSEWILPYDDVRALLTQAKSLYLRDCICRKQKGLIGERCQYPLRMCLMFAPIELPQTPTSVSLKEALAALDEAERVGLVHTVSNVAKGINYVCNCCGCCCGILRGITEAGVSESVAHANYYAEVDAELCTGCGECADRCQVGAVATVDGVAVVDLAKCIGCGLCASGCAVGAAELILKPENEIVHPPADFGVWEAERERRRSKPVL